MEPFYSEAQEFWHGDYPMQQQQSTSRAAANVPRAWSSGERKALNNKVLVHNFPIPLSAEEVREFLRISCPWLITVLACERANNRQPGKVSYIVQLNSQQEAQLVLDNVHGKRYMGSVLKVIPFSDEHVKHQRALNMSQTQESILQRLSHMSANNNGELLYPFRFLVPTFLIGAIIGVNGNTVKKFQVQSGAQFIIVDAQNEDERFPDEKPVTVFGTSESQIKALKLVLSYLDTILTVRRRESRFDASCVNTPSQTPVTTSAIVPLQDTNVDTPDSGCPSDNGQSVALDSSELSHKLMSSSQGANCGPPDNSDLIDYADDECDDESPQHVMMPSTHPPCSISAAEDLTPRQATASDAISCSSDNVELNDTLRAKHVSESTPASTPMPEGAGAGAVCVDSAACSDWDGSSRGSSPELTVLCSNTTCSDILSTSEDSTLSSSLISPVICKRHAELTADEAEVLLSKFVPPLSVRLLTHEHLLSRLIGKKGCNLSNIKSQTSTKITIPGYSPTGARFADVTRSNADARGPDRLVAIEGTRDNTTKAAKLMLHKLRNAYINDINCVVRSNEMQSLYPNTAWPPMPGNPGAPFLGAAATMGGLAPHLLASSQAADPFAMSRLGAALPMPSFASSMGGGPVGTMGAAAGHPPPGALPGGYQNPFLASALGAAPSAAQLTGGPQFTPIPMPPAFATSPYEQFQHQPESSVQETTYMYIHHGAVGAIIGNRGTNIHMIKQLSQAQVTVDTQSDHQDQRRITIVGTPDAQWKAQWLIIEKLRSDGFTQGEWPIVTVELPIPMAMVGRIIGKQGKKVLELQRESHAIIEVPMGAALGEDLAAAAAAGSVSTSTTKSSSSGSTATAVSSGANCGNSASASTTSTTNAASLPAAVINGILQSDNNEIMLVKLLGHFWALQSAQRKIRSIIHRGKVPSSGGTSGPTSSQPPTGAPINFIPTFPPASDQHLAYNTTTNPPQGTSTGGTPQVNGGSKANNPSTGSANATSASTGHMFFQGTCGNSAAPIATSAQLAAAASLSNIVGAPGPNQSTPVSAAINNALNSINSLGAKF